jgi:hypothetical protein
MTSAPEEVLAHSFLLNFLTNHPQEAALVQLIHGPKSRYYDQELGIQGSTSA